MLDMLTFVTSGGTEKYCISVYGKAESSVQLKCKVCCNYTYLCLDALLK